MTERMIEADGIELCMESFGEPTDLPILLVMGIGGSMLWWEEDSCRSVAEGGRFVIRYDHRDTGRSTTYAPGRPGYCAADLVEDATRVLDAYGLDPGATLLPIEGAGHGIDRADWATIVPAILDLGSAD